MYPFQQKPKDMALEKIECHIIANKLKPHDKLPSERDFCELYGFNRMTLRSALQSLTLDGAIYNKPGIGNFVAEPKITRGLSGLKSMNEYAEREGLNLSSAVISFDKSESTKEMASRLKVEIGSEIFILTRLRILNNIPLFIETAYLSAERFPNLNSYDFSKESLYRVLENDFDINIHCGEETITITYLNAFEANLLEQAEGTPTLFVRSTNWDDKGQAVEHIKSVARADIFCYTNVLNYSPKQQEGGQDD